MRLAINTALFEYIHTSFQMKLDIICVEKQARQLMDSTSWNEALSWRGLTAAVQTCHH